LALADNPVVVITVPRSPRSLGIQLERLLALLGGKVENCCGLTDEALADNLAKSGPSMIIGPADEAARALGLIHKQHPAPWNRLKNGLRFVVNVNPAGPLSRARIIATERALDADVLDIFTDGNSFAFASCPCGVTHPLPRYHLEVIDEQGTPSSGPGRMVVSDRLGRDPAVARYPTPFRVTLSSSPCSFFGQTAAVTCHGRQGEQLKTPAGSVGLLDLEEQLFTHGLFVRHSVRVGDTGWHVTVQPFHDEEVDVGAIEKGLCTRFQLPVKVEVGPS